MPSIAALKRGGGRGSVGHAWHAERPKFTPGNRVELRDPSAGGAASPWGRHGGGNGPRQREALGGGTGGGSEMQVSCVLPEVSTGPL